MPNEREVDVSNEGELIIFEFDIEGKTNAKKAPGSSVRLDARKAEQAAAEYLNEKADEIATRIQAEVERIFEPLAARSVVSDGPQTVVAAVEVEFRYESNRSLILAGVITALVVPFATQVAAGVISPPLAKLLESGVTRVVRRWQQEKKGELSNVLSPHNATLEPFTMNVSTRQVIQPGAQPLPSKPLTQLPSPESDTQLGPVDTRTTLTGQSSTPWLQVQQQTNPPPPVREMSGAVETSGTHWLFPAIAVGTAMIIVLLAVILTILIMQAP